jgi:hypothetical protein
LLILCCFLVLQEIFRMLPADYSDLVATIKAGHKTQVKLCLRHMCNCSSTPAEKTC